MRFALWFALFLSSCANPSGQVKPTTIRSPSGQVLCAVHHIPLTTVNGWCSGTITLVHPIDEAGRKFEECNPNQISVDCSRVRTKEFTIPKEITFCRWCDEGVGCDF
jgi:hypothetical protein